MMQLSMQIASRSKTILCFSCFLLCCRSCQGLACHSEKNAVPFPSVCSKNTKPERSKALEQVIECRREHDGRDRNSVLTSLRQLKSLRPSFDTSRPVVTETTPHHRDVCSAFTFPCGGCEPFS